MRSAGHVIRIKKHKWYFSYGRTQYRLVEPRFFNRVTVSLAFLGRSANTNRGVRRVLVKQTFNFIE